jgi:hypothetical protein
MLDSLLKYLVSPHRKDRPLAHKLAQSVITRCAGHLSPALTALLNGAIDGDAHVKRQSALQADYHEIIYELNKLGAPLLLVGVLPNLEKELTVEDAGVRLLATRQLARMFAAKGGQLAQQYRPLFATFLRRFGDADDKVRLVMCEHARALVVHHPEHAAAPCAAELQERLRDTAEDVRLAAVTAVCDIAKLVPERVPGALLAEVAMRVRDRRAPLRARAIRGLAELYAAARLDTSSPTPSWLASTLVAAFAGAPADRALVERTLAHVMLRRAPTPPPRRTRASSARSSRCSTPRRAPSSISCSSPSASCAPSSRCCSTPTPSRPTRGSWRASLPRSAASSATR